MQLSTRSAALLVVQALIGASLTVTVAAGPAFGTSPDCNARGPGVDLSGCSLANENLTSANLTNANLTGTNLSGANLTNANLTGANLTNANLTGANLTSTDLAGATIVNTRQGSFTYSATGSSLTVTGYTGSGGAEVLLSAPLPGFQTRVIGSFAFNNNTNVTTLVIPSTLTEIRDNAFLNSRLTAIGTANPPIGVSFPEGLHTIGANAFVQFSNEPATTSDYYLSGPLTLPSTLTSLGDGAFYRAGITGSVVIPGGVTSIGAATFEMTKIDEITLHDAVTSIGATAFARTGLTSLDLPESLASLGTGAFKDVGSPQVTGASIDWYRITPTLTGPLVIPAGVATVPADAFKGSSFSSIAFAGNTTSIGDYAFWSVTDPTFICPLPSQLTSLTLPASLVTIGASAFEGAHLLGGVLELPTSLTTIGGAAFVGNALSGVTFGPNVSNVGTLAIANNFTGDPCPAPIPGPLTGGTLTFTGAAPSFAGALVFLEENLTVRYPRGRAGWPLAAELAESVFGPGVTQVAYGEVPSPSPSPGGVGGGGPTPDPTPKPAPSTSASATSDTNAPSAPPTPTAWPTASPSLRVVGGGVSVATGESVPAAVRLKSRPGGASPASAPTERVRVNTPIQIAITDPPARTSLVAQAQIGRQWSRLGPVRKTKAGLALLPVIVVDRPQTLMIRVRGAGGASTYMRLDAR